MPSQLKPKVKIETLSSLKKEAWTACSLYVRLSETDEHGYGACITCGRVYHWKRLQAGHFVAGRTNAILFDLRGIHIQCYGCNVGQYGKNTQYFLWMEQHYGRETIDELLELKGTMKQFTMDELRGIRDDFMRRVEHLTSKTLE